ncbi:DNA polymerase III subunit beta [Nonomuraea longicatena]|uniref:Beta sliding clamp n=1 Tax=Nonomuraea longicatena TaxID=83682 RepID=A0ABN1NU57_9ACTN
MKIRLGRDVLADAVAWTARVLPSRPVAPVLSGLLLDATDDLSLSAFDYDVSARARIEAVVDEPGQVLIPGRLMAEIGRSLPADDVEIVTDGAEAILTCGSAEFGLITMPVEDYPTLPTMPESIGAVGGGVFAEAVTQVAPASSRDDTLPMLTGIRVDIDGDAVAMAATDRYRIAARDLTWRPARPGLSVSAMVPAKVMVEVAKSLRGGEVSIALGDGVAGFESVGRSTTVRLLDEQFIDYRARLSNEWGIKADVPVAPLVEAIKRVALVAERNTAIRLSFTENQVRIQAGGGDLGRGSEVVGCELRGAEIQIAFQSHFLLDGLTAVETEFARINMDSPTRAALIQDVPGDAEPFFRYLVMSLRQ